MEDNATQGIWGQFSCSNGPFREEAKKRTDFPKHIDSSHEISTIMEDGTPKRIAHFTHAADAALAETLVNKYRSGELVENTLENAATLVMKTVQKLYEESGMLVKGVEWENCGEMRQGAYALYILTNNMKE